MLWDILITVGLAVITFTSAYLGVHVSLHPTTDDDRRAFYKWAFIVCGILAVTLLAIQAYRNVMTQNAFTAQLNRIDKNTQQPPKIEVKVPPASGASPSISSTRPHLQAPKTPNTTYEQKCEGSACAQGDNAQATYNQFGPPKYQFGPEIQSLLTKGLLSLSGKSIGLFTQATNRNALDAGNFFYPSAVGAKVNFEDGTPLSINVGGISGANSTGMCLSYPDGSSGDADKIRVAIRTSGMFSGPIPRCPGLRPDILGVYIAPLE